MLNTFADVIDYLVERFMQRPLFGLSLLTQQVLETRKTQKKTKRSEFEDMGMPIKKVAELLFNVMMMKRKRKKEGERERENAL